MATRTAVINPKQKLNGSVRGRKKKRKTLGVPMRILIVLIFLFIGLVALIGKLVYLQVFSRSDQYAAQLNQLVDEVQITAPRGNIYDRNMNVLVQDSSAKAVNLIPKSVEDPEKVASELSEKLNIEYDKVYAITQQLEDDKVQVSDNVYGKNTDSLLATLNNDEAYTVENNAFYVRPDKVKNAEADAKAIALALELEEKDVLDYITSKENTTVLVKNKVDNQLAEKIKSDLSTVDENGEVTSTNGVELLEDKMRYYTNGNFASYILGFTGSDHEGLYGVEKAFDEQLSGTKGIVYYQKDAKGNVISSQTKLVQESQKGDDLVLSIDSNIQSATEKALEKTVNEWQAKEGIAIVMNVKTGEIISMASKPDYDLNNPYELSEEYEARHSSDLKSLDKAEKLEKMWQNPAVSFIYEPGSTFKPVTVSIALEEGAITPSTTFNCTGAINVAGTVINCTGVHGTQSIQQILENSCNPGLVQIINGVDPNDFYKYVYNYGFGTNTGVELTGEEEGIVNRVFMDDGTIKMVDYSTFSFGQGIATTPIQIITALNSIINNGYYVQPTILKGNGKTSPKQIISSSTSETLRKEMRGVLEQKTLLDSTTDGYVMGGKTGTAEKFVDGSYNTGKYVTSFFCFSPIDDPQYCAMVILDEPKNGASGADSAAPTAIEILKQTLIYTGSNPNEASAAAVIIPDLSGKNKGEAETILQERGINYHFEETGAGDIVIAQSIPGLTAYDENEELVLTLGSVDPNSNRIIPDFTGMTVQGVNELVKQFGIHLEIKGSGFAVNQSIAPGTEVEPGTKLTVTFEE